MKTSEFLIKAKSLIADPKHWTQEHYARDNEGNICYWDDSGAVCFCSVGALYETSGYTHQGSRNGIHPVDPLLTRAYTYLDDAIGYTSIPLFNDKHTHEQVMQMWDKAIAQAIADEEKEG